MGHRFRARKHESFQRCPSCGIRLNMSMPYCSRVCMDSGDAQAKRDLERVTSR